jgi:hypothetical protein
MGDWPNKQAWLETLGQPPPVPHSEADFQHALAWVIQMFDVSARVRLETRPTPGMQLDMVISKPDLGQHLVLELKYLTASWLGDVRAAMEVPGGQQGRDTRATAKATCLYACLTVMVAVTWP